MNALVADIGATNARFALANDKGLLNVKTLACNDHPSLEAAAKTYLEGLSTSVRIESAALAIAAPLDGSDQVTMINHPWNFSIEQTRQTLGLKSLRALNDFEALAYGVLLLKEDDYYAIGNATAQKDKPVAIIGPGTGLGVAGIVFKDGTPVIVPTEGGHVTMPAANAREFALFEWLKKEKYSHVSAERVISGKGLVNVYHALCGIDGRTLPERTAAEITQAALTGVCPVCRETVDLFCRFLGVVAGNLALSYGAFGGVYIAGGIVPKLGEQFFRESSFHEGFLAKGRFKAYVEKIPVRIITHPYAALEGLRYTLTCAR